MISPLTQMHLEICNDAFTRIINMRGYPTRGPHRKTVFFNGTAEQKSLRSPGIED